MILLHLLKLLLFGQLIQDVRKKEDFMVNKKKKYFILFKLATHDFVSVVNIKSNWEDSLNYLD